MSTNDNTSIKNFKTELGRIMSQRGISAAELSRQSGVDPSTISRLVNALKRDIFLSKDAVPIAAALKLPVAEVFPEFFNTIRRKRISHVGPRRLANMQDSVAG